MPCPSTYLNFTKTKKTQRIKKKTPIIIISCPNDNQIRPADENLWMVDTEWS